MKRMLTGVMVLLLAAPGFAAEPVKVSGSVELQYKSGFEEYSSLGGDEMSPEELYVQFEAAVTKEIDVLLKLDGSDMDRDDGDDSKYVEEANLTFKKPGVNGLTIVVGKDEMPFGQDYEKFMLSSVTHGLEIDKVWGINGNYNIKNVGKFSLGFFERDRDADTALTSSYTMQLSKDFGNRFMGEVSYAVIAKDKLDPLEEDETRTNAGFVFKVDKNITVHGEYTNIGNVDNADGVDSTVMLAGVDYKYGKYLMKARYETVDEDRDVEVEKRMAIGADYNYNDNTSIALEYQTTSYTDNAGASVDDSSGILIGAKTRF